MSCRNSANYQSIVYLPDYLINRFRLVGDEGPRSKPVFHARSHFFRHTVSAPVVKSIELSSEVTLPYVEQGEISAVPVIFLHAIADSSHSFERVLTHLRHSIHAFAITQRGHGDASRPAEAPDRVTSDLAAFVEEVQAAFQGRRTKV